MATTTLHDRPPAGRASCGTRSASTSITPTCGSVASPEAATRAARLFARWTEGIVAALGRHGVHTDDFTAEMWPEMTHLHCAHPGEPS